MINNYEQELLHDILYYGRGRGFIKESELFSTAYPMIIGVTANNRFGHSLNALQSYNLFESYKRIIELNKIRVVFEPELTWREKSGLEDECVTTRQDMTTAAKIKKGIISIEPRKIRCSDDRDVRSINLLVLRALYGLDDGVIKNRFEDTESPYGRGEYLRVREIRALREIYKSEVSGTPLKYVE